MPEQDQKETSIISGEVIKDARGDDESAINDTVDGLRVLIGVPKTEFQDGRIVDENPSRSNVQAKSGIETNVLTGHRHSGLSLTDSGSWKTLTALRSRIKSKKAA